nr:hypothetical protein BJQ95_02990 [Cryobacterium sp. SO1]
MAGCAVHLAACVVNTSSQCRRCEARFDFSDHKTASLLTPHEALSIKVVVGAVKVMTLTRRSAVSPSYGRK